MIVCYVLWGDGFGPYLEAAFSALTFMRDPAVEKVCFVAERPEYMKLFAGRADIVAPGSDAIREWGGEFNFLFRKKILGIMAAREHCHGADLLYVDSDTFLAADLAGLQQALRAGGVCMHEINGEMNRATDRANQRMWSKLAGKTLAGMTIPPNVVRRNAGVIGLPGASADAILRQSVDMCDAMYVANDRYKGSEEVAFSTVLGAHGPVVDAADVVGHYWGNKVPWRHAIADFFARGRLEGGTLDDDIARAAAFDFRTMPIRVHVPKRRRVIGGLLEKYVPLRQVRHYPEKLKPW